MMMSHLWLLKTTLNEALTFFPLLGYTFSCLGLDFPPPSSTYYKWDMTIYFFLVSLQLNKHLLKALKVINFTS